MSETPAELPAFPAVARDTASAAFFDAAARGELLVQRCTGCATVLPPEARTCHSCGVVELTATVVSGRGRLVSWVVVTQAPIPALAGAVPYVTALIELEEGPWLFARLIDTVGGFGSFAVGNCVSVDFVRSGSGDQAAEMLPVFRSSPS